MKLCWKVDMIKVLIAVMLALGFVALSLPAHSALNPNVNAELKNAWDNTHVWAFATGIHDPFTAVWESRDASGRLLESQKGITAQLTLDDDWRTIDLLGVIGDKRYVIISIRAKFKGNIPIYETVKGAQPKK